MEDPSTRIRETLQRRKAYGLDTMAFIYHFEENPTYTTFTKPLFELIEAGETRGVTSTISLMEILVKPKQLGDLAAVEDYKYALTNFPNLKLRNLDPEVAEKAAEIRARHNTRLPDAIQIATSLIEEAEAFITNDTKLRNISEIEIIIMKEILENRE